LPNQGFFLSLTHLSQKLNLLLRQCGEHLLIKKGLVLEIDFASHFQGPAAALGNLDRQVRAFFHGHSPQKHQIWGLGGLGVQVKLVQGDRVVNRGQIVEPEVIAPLGMGHTDQIFPAILAKEFLPVAVVRMPCIVCTTGVRLRCP
jgi:hypothetical protein